MGVEVMGSDMAQVAIEKVAEVDRHEKENGKQEKHSGPHVDEPVKGEGVDVADAKVPKDAIDEWPAQRQIHTFYFVRCRPFDDPKIKTKIDQADREIQKNNQARFQITEELKAKRSERKEISELLRTLRSESDQYKAIFDEKKKEMEPLQQALGKLRTNNAARGGLCSSEEELNDVIHSLQYHMQHESITLTEEKQILREIKQLEATREKVIANSAMRAKIQDSLGQKEAIQDQVKLMGADLDGVRKEQQSVWGKITQLREKVKALDSEINSLQDDLTAVTEKRDKAYENIKSLRLLREEGNIHFYNSRKLITKAKELAAERNIEALEKLSHDEVDNFMSLWSNNKVFRDDYEKRILPSLDSRQLSRDGRIRNPDEKPLVAVETPFPAEPEPVAKASNVKRAKEDSKPAPQKESLPTQKVQKESNNKDLKVSRDHVDAGDDMFELEKQPKNSSSAKVVDEAKLKELKKADEIAKAKQAMERKKKLAEKAAQKAAIRAKKEEEKKLKDKEKKLRKKAAQSAPPTEPEEPAEAIAEVEETEKLEVQDETSAHIKERVKKEIPVRHRNRPRGGDSLPKAILRKKKTSSNYWMWAAAAAAASLGLLFVALGYYFSSLKK